MRLKISIIHYLLWVCIVIHCHNMTKRKVKLCQPIFYEIIFSFKILVNWRSKQIFFLVSYFFSWTTAFSLMYDNKKSQIIVDTPSKARPNKNNNKLLINRKHFWYFSRLPIVQFGYRMRLHTKLSLPVTLRKSLQNSLYSWLALLHRYTRVENPD